MNIHLNLKDCYQLETLQMDCVSVGNKSLQMDFETPLTQQPCTAHKQREGCVFVVN